MSRRRFLVAAAVTLVALLALAAALLRKSEGRDPILERALANVSDGPILHSIVRERAAAGQWYEVENGRPVATMSVHESWVDPERGRIRAIERRNGQVVRDAVVGSDGVAGEQTKAKLVTEYKRRLERDELRVVRAGTLRGRNVHWLSSPSAEAAVDAETYRLVRIQSLGGHFRTVLDFDLLESRPRRDSDFAVGAAAPVVVRGRLSAGRDVTLRAAARAVAGAQWAGDRVADLSLRTVRTSAWRATLSPGGDVRGRILEVAYGERLGTSAEPATGLPTGVEIVQAADGDPARRALVPAGQPTPPPAGTFDLSRRIDASGTRYAATLRKPGAWILVRASSRELVFETVRLLRAIPRA